MTLRMKMKEIRRKVKVLSVFPDVQSSLYLVAARLRWVEQKRWNRRVYLDMELLVSQEPGGSA